MSTTKTIRRLTSSGHEAEIELAVPDAGETGPAVHFSLTGTLQGTSGAIADELAAQFPELRPFAALHLADAAGVPMHAEANGRYWHEHALGLVAPATYDERPLDVYRRRACELLRVDEIPHRLDELGEELRAVAPDDDPEPAREKYLHAWAEFVDAQRDRWAGEADRARAELGALDSTIPERFEVDEDGPGLFELIDALDEFVGARLSARLTSGARFDSRDLLDVQAAARRALDDDELDDDERADLRRLVALIDDLSDEGGPDWRHGETWVPESGWVEYAEEYAADVGSVPDDSAEWPARHIDWKAAAAELRQDYTESEIGGETYLHR